MVITHSFESKPNWRRTAMEADPEWMAFLERAQLQASLRNDGRFTCADCGNAMLQSGAPCEHCAVTTRQRFDSLKADLKRVQDELAAVTERQLEAQKVVDDSAESIRKLQAALQVSENVVAKHSGPVDAANATLQDPSPKLEVIRQDMSKLTQEITETEREQAENDKQITEARNAAALMQTSFEAAKNAYTKVCENISETEKQQVATRRQELMQLQTWQKQDSLLDSSIETLLRAHISLASAVNTNGYDQIVAPFSVALSKFDPTAPDAFAALDDDSAYVETIPQATTAENPEVVVAAEQEQLHTIEIVPSPTSSSSAEQADIEEPNGAHIADLTDSRINGSPKAASALHSASGDQQASEDSALVSTSVSSSDSEEDQADLNETQDTEASEHVVAVQSTTSERHSLEAATSVNEAVDEHIGEEVTDFGRVVDISRSDSGDVDESLEELVKDSSSSSDEELTDEVIGHVAAVTHQEVAVEQADSVEQEIGPTVEDRDDTADGESDSEDHAAMRQESGDEDEVVGHVIPVTTHVQMAPQEDSNSEPQAENKEEKSSDSSYLHHGMGPRQDSFSYLIASAAVLRISMSDFMPASSGPTANEERSVVAEAQTDESSHGLPAENLHNQVGAPILEHHGPIEPMDHHSEEGSEEHQTDASHASPSGSGGHSTPRSTSSSSDKEADAVDEVAQDKLDRPEAVEADQGNASSPEHERHQSPLETSSDHEHPAHLVAAHPDQHLHDPFGYGSSLLQPQERTQSGDDSDSSAEMTFEQHHHSDQLETLGQHHAHVTQHSPSHDNRHDKPGDGADDSTEMRFEMHSPEKHEAGSSHKEAHSHNGHGNTFIGERQAQPPNAFGY